MCFLGAVHKTEGQSGFKGSTLFFQIFLIPLIISPKSRFKCLLVLEENDCS